MSTADAIADAQNDRTRNLMLAFVRIAVLALWAVWCFRILGPFVTFLVWGVLIAVALHPLHLWLTRVLGGRPRTSALIITLLQLVLVVGPMLAFGAVVVENLRSLANKMVDGSLGVPPPPADVQDWPLIGPSLYDLWELADTNLDLALERLGPELKAVGRWVLQAAAGAGLGIVQFIAAVIAAGFMMLHGAGGRRAAHGLARGLAGAERGDHLADLAGATVRSVARGVLGVAVIQAVMAGVGMLVMGVPFAGIWTLVALILAVVQIGVGPVLIPAVIWAYSTQSAFAASLFLVWAVVCMVSDNILKPMLLGRGVAVPMPVVFLGAIGGMLRSGIIGLFVGAVILSLGYTVLVDWIRYQHANDEEDAEQPQPA
jgi:predicted PurR-regulated permease PerM